MIPSGCVICIPDPSSLAQWVNTTGSQEFGYILAFVTVALLAYFYIRHWRRTR